MIGTWGTVCITATAKILFVTKIEFCAGRLASLVKSILVMAYQPNLFLTQVGEMKILLPMLKVSISPDLIPA